MIWNILLFLCIIAFLLFATMLVEKASSKKDKENIKERQMTIVEKCKAVAAEYKAVLEAYKKETCKQCYAIEIDEGIPTELDSSIGGIPYLPAGEVLPTDKNGDPMILFVQLDLEGTSLLNYPNKGILQVFLGKEIGYPTEYKIRYYENIEADYQKDIEIVNNNWLGKTLKVRLTKSEGFLPPSDEKFNDYFIPVYNKVMGTNFKDFNEIEDYDKITDVLYQSIVPANFGGYADTTQFQDFNYEENEVLLKIDSNLNNSIYIGDAGILWVLITKEDLKSRKITEAWVDWDCY